MFESHKRWSLSEVGLVREYVKGISVVGTDLEGPRSDIYSADDISFHILDIKYGNSIYY